jgi:hypothetical protein
MKLRVAAGVEGRLLAGSSDGVLVGCASGESLWLLQALPAPEEGATAGQWQSRARAPPGGPLQAWV